MSCAVPRAEALTCPSAPPGAALPLLFSQCSSVSVCSSAPVSGIIQRVLHLPYRKRGAHSSGEREPSRPPPSTHPLHCVFQHGHLTPPLPASSPQTNISCLMSHKATRPLLNCRASFWLVLGYNEPILIALDSTQSHASTPLYHFLCPECPLKGRQFLPNCLENCYPSCKPNVDVFLEGKPSWIMWSFLHR